MNFHKKFRIRHHENIDLTDFDAGETAGLDKEEALVHIEKNVEELIDEQYKLYAENKRALLIVLQGMDTAGKDGVIRHVMRGINPQGCTVSSFKTPTKEDLGHDFLWRIHKAVPEKGDFGIFNRSHYEDVLIVRVKNLIPKHEWKKRYSEINDFEKMLTENGVTILKFFLNISKQEQKERLEKRLQDPKKNWKFSENDLKERGFWDDYMEAYSDMLSRCSTKHAPWYIIPSNKKWFRNLAVSEILVHTLKDMDLKIPKPIANLSKIRIK